MEIDVITKCRKTRVSDGARTRDSRNHNAVEIAKTRAILHLYWVTLGPQIHDLTVEVRPGPETMAS